MTFCNSFILEIEGGSEAGRWRNCSLEFRLDQRWGQPRCCVKSPEVVCSRWALNCTAVCRSCQIFQDVLVSQKLMNDFFGDPWMNVLMKWNIFSNPAAATAAGPAHPFLAALEKDIRFTYHLCNPGSGIASHSRELWVGDSLDGEAAWGIQVLTLWSPLFKHGVSVEAPGSFTLPTAQ